MNESAMISNTTIKIRDINKRFKHFIPKISKNYIFQDFVYDMILDMQMSPPKPIMLTGLTGTGKSSCFVEIAARINQPIIRVNLNHQTTISDFVGTWIVKNKEMIWIDGVLPYCMKNGIWLILDEIDFADPAILSVLNTVLEKDGYLCLKEKGHDIIHPHKDFFLGSTANTAGCMAEYRYLYQGTNIMNEAFLNRWRVYHVDYLKEEDEAKVLFSEVFKTVNNSSKGSKPSPEMVKTTNGISKKLVEIATVIRKAFLKEEVSFSFSTRMLMDWAEMIIRHRSKEDKSPNYAASLAIYPKISKEDAKVFKEYLRKKLDIQNETTF